jgi:hypothetical protein
MIPAARQLNEPRPIGAETRFLGLSALDRLMLVYVLAAFILLAAHVANWRYARPTRWETECLIASHALALIFALLAPIARDRSRTDDSFVAEWYPVMVMAGLYAAVGLLNTGALRCGHRRIACQHAVERREQERIDQDRQDRTGENEIAATLRHQRQRHAEPGEDERELADLRERRRDCQRG